MQFKPRQAQFEICQRIGHDLLPHLMQHCSPSLPIWRGQCWCTHWEEDVFLPLTLNDTLDSGSKDQYEKMLEIERCGVSGFRHDQNLITERGVAENYGAKDAYEIDASVIDTGISMAWLMDLVRAKGSKLITESIRGCLLTQEPSLRERFNANVIVNATGLAAKETANDSKLYPLRGTLIRVQNNSLRLPKPTGAGSV